MSRFERPLVAARLYAAQKGENFRYTSRGTAYTRGDRTMSQKKGAADSVVNSMSVCIVVRLLILQIACKDKRPSYSMQDNVTSSNSFM